MPLGTSNCTLFEAVPISALIQLRQSNSIALLLCAKFHGLPFLQVLTIISSHSTTGRAPTLRQSSRKPLQLQQHIMYGTRLTLQDARQKAKRRLHNRADYFRKRHDRRLLVFNSQKIIALELAKHESLQHAVSELSEAVAQQCRCLTLIEENPEQRNVKSLFASLKRLGRTLTHHDTIFNHTQNWRHF